MKETVISYIKEILEEQNKETKLEITEDSNLRDLGLSSYDLASLTVKIEDEYDIDIFEDGVVLTVGEIITILKENA
ncbi:acyl carrier protein [Aquimarina sp. LLG6339-5]|uniref:acyl carrier protein n=1 Tax=Aquimarina sp. LLG6339-5 TaxID=3160830 RepID=UPI0038699782